jgi:HAD superfamily hydrolase (TIGR01509 family)
VVIFDCNGVLVDSEAIASAVLSEFLQSAGMPLTAEAVTRAFHGRRPADVFTAVERYTGKRLPPGLADRIATETLRRLRTELRPVPHVAHALTWVRGPKAVASSCAHDRIRVSLEVTGLTRFFERRLFSASEVAKGKPAPDLFLLAAERMRVDPRDCIVVEDSVAGVAAAKAAGMRPIGFVGPDAGEGSLAHDLLGAGARAVIADMRALKGAILDLRGW